MLPRLDDLLELDLGPLSPRPNPVAGLPMQASTALWASDDGRIEIGVWFCTPGRFASSRKVNSEFSMILQGRATLFSANSEPIHLSPNCSVNLPLGWSGEWEITEAIRKLYVTTTAVTDRQD